MTLTPSVQTQFLSAQDVAAMVNKLGAPVALSRMADAKTYAFKYVNGHPKNPRVGLPTALRPAPGVASSSTTAAASAMA